MITISGYSFQLTSEHRFPFQNGSKLQFTLWFVEQDSAHGRALKATDTLKDVAAEMIRDFHTRCERSEYGKRFNGLSLVEVMEHSDFRYGRLILDNEGNCKYVNVYCYDKFSPTGVVLCKGCKLEEFEYAAAATGNSHNYLVGNEGRREVA